MFFHSLTLAASNKLNVKMEDIYLDKPIEIENIRENLSELFTDLEVFYWDFVDEEPSNFNSENSNQIFFNTIFDEDRKEFAFVISIYRTPDENSYERQLFLAEYFSKKHKIRTLAPYIHPEKPNYPYYDIIFTENNAFLADDSDTSFGDGTENLIEIIQRIEIPVIKFDTKANLMNETSS
jgi:hypothetical protein